MIFRMSWLICMLVYLSINGQVFATPIHLCHSMAKTSVSSKSSSAPLKTNELQYVTENVSTSDEMFTQKTMENCHCVECDCTSICECTSSRTAQANSFIVNSKEIVDFSTSTEDVIANTEQQLISPRRHSLYRPPIFI